MGRIILPNYPHHVIQRSHNRQVVFAGEADFCRYLDDERKKGRKKGTDLFSHEDAIK
jgi:putative transposase